MTWVKICGMTNLEDALIAVDAGADAVGFVFYEKSPRCVSVETVREIVERLPAEVEKIGVFVNQVDGTLCDVADRSGLTAVQMHGDNEDPHVADLVIAKRPKLKVLAAVSMSKASPDGWAMLWHPDAVHAFLADSGDSSKSGGTGKIFDWTSSGPAVQNIKKLGRVVAAGGLTPGNVGEAIAILRPWGVDVVSGVEARPGKKDPDKVRAFVKAVRDFDRKVG
ncbi:MAG: phosphoribosylanthranilate isomerase [Candidatus Sulfotelmatobacter sp.]